MPDLVWKCSDNLEFTCNDPEVMHDTNAAILRSVLAHGPRTWPKTIAAHASNDLTISYHNVKKVLTRVRRKSTAKTPRSAMEQRVFEHRKRLPKAKPTAESKAAPQTMQEDDGDGATSGSRGNGKHKAE